MDVVRNGKIASKIRNSICRKKGFQMFCHPSQFREYAKLKTNKEMGFEMGEKRTYKK